MPVDDGGQGLARQRELEAIVYGRPGVGAAAEARREAAELELEALRSVPDAQLPDVEPLPVARWPLLAAIACGTVVAGVLAIAALSGPVVPVAPTGAAAPTPTPTPVRQGNDGIWDSLMRDFPDAVQPVVETVQPVAETVVATAIASCMHAAGYSQVNAVAGNGIAVGSVPAGQQEAFNRAMYVCRVQYPIDSISVFDRGQYPEETDYEAKAASMRLSGAISGSVRLLASTADYKVVAFRMVDANRPDPLICVQLALPGEATTRGYCTIPQVFISHGIQTPNGVNWGPTGNAEVGPQ